MRPVLRTLHLLPKREFPTRRRGVVVVCSFVRSFALAGVRSRRFGSRDPASVRSVGVGAISRARAAFLTGYYALAPPAAMLPGRYCGGVILRAFAGASCCQRRTCEMNCMVYRAEPSRLRRLRRAPIGAEGRRFKGGIAAFSP